MRARTFFLGLLITIGSTGSGGCKSGNTTGIEGNDNDGNAVAIGDNNVIIQDGKAGLAQTVDIIGSWDKNKAADIVLQSLHESWDSVANNYSHEIYGFYNMEYVDKEAVIGVAFSRPRRGLNADGMDTVHSCHACHGEVSFIEFHRYANGWKVANKFIRALESGQWGEMSENYRLINIGYHRFGFVCTGGFTGQGYTESFTSIYSILGGEFKEIFGEMTGFDDSGAKDISEDSYNSKIDVVKEGTSFYDLIVTVEGIRKGQPFKESNYYKFDGQKYSLSNDLK